MHVWRDRERDTHTQNQRKKREKETYGPGFVCAGEVGRKIGIERERKTGLKGRVVTILVLRDEEHRENSHRKT